MVSLQELTKRDLVAGAGLSSAGAVEHGLAFSMGMEWTIVTDSEGKQNY